jgi:membrane-associated PAP2 superfamily phosphatase
VFEFFGIVNNYPKYSISNLGRVRSLHYGLLKPGRDGDGYLQVALYNSSGCKWFKVHRLVTEYFLGPRPRDMEVCHNNGIITDNRLCNLRYDTKAGNFADKKKHGTENFGTKNGQNILSETEVMKIVYLLKLGVYQKDIAREVGVSQATVSNIASGKTWSWLTGLS